MIGACALLLADDHAVVRDGLQALLETEPGFKVVAAVGNGLQAVSAAQQLHPDVAVLDIAMPEMNGIEATARMATVAPRTRVVVLSMHGSSELVYRALQAGARGYVLKESAGHALVAAVRAVQAGRRFLDDRIEDVVVNGYLESERHASPLDALSPRERSILQMIVEGRSNADCARALFLSVKSVETYRSRLMQKLGIADLPALVKFAIEHGLTQLEKR
ncbi:MAG TPA: response regulator transcription factor [Nevskiaceae bacterium]|nr:response regulator transcription factor [Nevskiaceae bacterium]